jgi:hypothetical protein
MPRKKFFHCRNRCALPVSEVILGKWLLSRYEWSFEYEMPVSRQVKQRRDAYESATRRSGTISRIRCTEYE